MKSIRAKNFPNIFNITSTPSVPAFLPINENIDIAIDYKPTVFKDYLDCLLVETDSPCSFTYISSLKGSSKSAETIVFLPDTIASVGQKDFCIPLTLIKGVDFVEPPNLTFSAKISFDASMMKVDTPQDGQRISDLNYFTFSGGNIVFTNGRATLGEICGEVMLPNENTTPLTIEEFRWSEPKIQTRQKNGSLTVKDLCQKNISRIRLIQKVEILLSPNPVGDFLEISVGAQGTVPEIYIFNVFGEEILKNSNSNNSQLRIDVSGLPSGMYFLRVGDKVGKFIKI